MSEEQILKAVLERVSVEGGPVSIAYDEVQEWPSGVLEAMIKAKWLTKDVHARSLECDGCEKGCYMPVLFTEDAARAYIVCDDQEMQDVMGRIAVHPSRLQQWQMTPSSIATILARLLGLKGKPEYNKDTRRFKLGMLKGKSGRRWILLNVQPLALVVQEQAIDLTELLYLDSGQWVLDELRIVELLDSATGNVDAPYIPDTSQREARKLETQAMHQDWKDEFQILKRSRPNKTLDWYAMQISKLPMAKGRDYATIKKNMKS